MKNCLFKHLLIIGLLTINTSVMAEDVDLFVGSPASATEIPNVLIILDNTANWNTPFANEIAALVSTINALPVGTGDVPNFRLGLMMFTETGDGNSGEDGAYVRAAIRNLNTANKAKYVSLISSIDKTDDKSNGGKVGKAMEEAYLYFTGKAPHAGNNKKKTDYTGNTSGSASSNAIYALAGNALTAKDGATYVSPIVANCAKNFIVYISNGAAQDNTSDIAQATAALTAAGGSTTVIPISPSGSQDNMADEWARFMKKSKGIKTYTLDVDKVTTGQGPGFTTLLKSMATVSSGKYFDVSSSGTDISEALSNIFSEIQSVDSVFSSVSLPVSVNTQGTFLNQIYVGMFRPDPSSFPRWNGNLKQYKLGFSNNVLQLLDADNAAAISSNSGFIRECARSYWTPTVLDTYWSFSPQGNCLTANTENSNTPDGNIVEKGAQGYQLRSATPTSRNMKTCSPASCTTLTDFKTTNTAITTALLGAADTTERDLLINWQRGLNVDNERNNAVLTETRASVHGDVVHSRPVAINYGTDAAPQIVVFYGGNDGVLRAVNGNRTAGIGTTAAGSELWSFVPPEYYSKIKRNRDNTTTISFPGHTTGTPTPLPKDYGFDGAITAYKQGTTTSIFATMRRGGRAVYAFDVSTASTPVLKWKVGCPNLSDDVGCTSLSDIGQTWSSPKVITSAGYGSGNSPMLIMGGGYDVCHDADPNSGCTSSSKGTKIYVLDAASGSALKTFNTDSSVIADLTIVPDTTTGLIKYAYAADLGGNIYRISGVDANTAIGTTAPGSWTITKVAALGGSGANNRKFMFAPDIVDDNGTYNILIGSGDREKPLASYTSASAVINHFYLVKDKPADTTWLTSENTNCGANVMCTNSLLAITSTDTPTQADLASKKGWYLVLASTEKVVTNAITVFGTVTFSTHQPTAPSGGQCDSLGTANVYNINYKNAAPVGATVRGQVIAGGGLPPSPVAGMVTLDDGSTVPFIIGASPDSALQGGDPVPASTVVRPRSRVYWNIKK